MAVRRSHMGVSLILAVIALPTVTYYVRTGNLPNHLTLVLILAVVLATFVMTE